HECACLWLTRRTGALYPCNCDREPYIAKRGPFSKDEAHLPELHPFGSASGDVARAAAAAVVSRGVRCGSDRVRSARDRALHVETCILADTRDALGVVDALRGMERAERMARAGGAGFAAAARGRVCRAACGATRGAQVGHALDRLCARCVGFDGRKDFR